MTDLERLVSAVLTQWRADGGGDHEPIAVSALLDRVLPYRVARRLLGLDASEDYEALVLRLLSQEEALVQVVPEDAAELARATANSRLPDLDVLQLLRPASFTVAERMLVTPAQVVEAPQLQETTTWAAIEAPFVEAAPAPAPPEPIVPTVAPHCWSCAESLPPGRNAKFCPFCGADQRQPVCGACGAAAERGWKHCAECGVKL